jgi:hypothetical protein
MKLLAILAVLLISMPAISLNGSAAKRLFSVEYSENSMGGDSPEPTYTLRFVNPPKGHDQRPPGFSFKLHQDAEGPVFWGAYLNGKRCDKILN